MKKVFKILFVVFLVTIYFNIGYHVGENAYRAEVKSLQGEELNLLEKIQNGPYNWLRGDKLKTTEILNTITLALFIILWPIALLAYAVTWLIYAVICGGVILWKGIVFLFKFIFLGGFFKLLGFPLSVIVILGVVIGIILFIAGRRMRKSKAKEEK